MHVIQNIEVILEHCYGCHRPWREVKVEGRLSFYTLIIGIKTRRCCAECFYDKPELQHHWMG